MPAAASLFKSNLNSVFVETGTFWGAAVDAALSVGFKRAISIELQKHYYDRCKAHFAGDNRVQLILGDSAVELGPAISEIKEPITFWLDGHFSGGDTGFGMKGAPLLEELEQIRQHPLAHLHTILIDDRRMLQKTGQGGRDTFFELTEADVVAKLKQINPNIQISYADGHQPNDIIVAKPPTTTTTTLQPIISQNCIANSK